MHAGILGGGHTPLERQAPPSPRHLRWQPPPPPRRVSTLSTILDLVLAQSPHATWSPDSHGMEMERMASLARRTPVASISASEALQKAQTRVFCSRVRCASRAASE